MSHIKKTKAFLYATLYSKWRAIRQRRDVDPGKYCCRQHACCAACADDKKRFVRALSCDLF